jgi:hypothetical protein
MPIQISNIQAQKLLSDEGYQYLTSAIVANGTIHVGNQVNIDRFKDLDDSIIAGAGIAYFAEHSAKPIETLLSTEGYNAYSLLTRNNLSEVDDAKSRLTQYLIGKTTALRLMSSFGLFGAMLITNEEDSINDCILTPAAMMLVNNKVDKNSFNQFDPFQEYIDQESEHSYGPVMEYVLRSLHVSDLKFSAVYHKRALPIFVQMMRDIPEAEMIDLRNRFDTWVLNNVTDYDKFVVVAVGALQIFYMQVLTKSDWPK